MFFVFPSLSVTQYYKHYYTCDIASPDTNCQLATDERMELQTRPQFIEGHPVESLIVIGMNKIKITISSRPQMADLYQILLLRKCYNQYVYN